MKKNIAALLLLASTLLNPVLAQKKFYTSDHEKKDFTSEEINLDFKSGRVKLKRPQSATFLAAAIPLVLDFGFKATTKMLEKNIKKFTAEYSKYNSCLQLYENPPVIRFSRNISFEDQADQPALIIELVPKQSSDTLLSNYIYYEISELELNYSAAKSTKKFPTFDYTIELKLDYVDNKERKSLELKPIVVSSVAYKQTPPNLKNARTELIEMPDKTYILGASIKIVETNPGKVRAEKILSAWNDNKEGARTIINYFVPKEKDDKDDQAQAATEAPAADGEATVSSKPEGSGDKKTPKKIK
ncbi:MULTISPECIES: hypothetical protein [Flavobacterium]|uniref:hypothetical protein n=1 Tax=Flavobacterium TaxID=237 RepID=UPI002113D26B|nr:MULTISPECIES: hypothetical protein [Flavobacterium]UUF13119.1 hypothetical protein NLJ00_17815 [Flavobacterium panici]